MRLLFSIAFMLCLPVLTHATHATPVSELWENYHASVKNNKKLHWLQQLAQVYESNRADRKYDSVANLAIETAQMTGDNQLLVDAYTLYFKKKKYSRPAEALDYARNLLSLAGRAHKNEWLYLANVSYAKIYLAQNEHEQALERVSKAYYYAGLTDNDTFKVSCFLVWGKCLEQTNDKLDAFRNYLNALNIAQKRKMTDKVFDCYGDISFFYLLIGNNERAREYKLKQLALVTEQGKEIDSLQLMYLQSDLSVIYYYNQERTQAEKLTGRIIQYALAHGDSVLFEEALVNHSTYLAENGYFQELTDFYTVKYPDELEKLAQKDPIAYNRVSAFINEVKGENDAALQDYKITEQMIMEKRAHEYLYISNFMKRYAQFLMRTGNVYAAKEKMEASYQSAQQADYLPYLIETSDYLDTINYNAGNVSDAYMYSKMNKDYRARQDIATKQDALLLLEIDNEAKQREIAAALEQSETEHRHNLQYMGIIIAIIASFILLTALGSFKVPAIFIKSLGFFSFIFFFEFIILLADHKIMEITHHEPWKMLAIKILIISFLLPFHHWIEHKVIHYLVAHRLIDTRRLSLKRLFGRNAPQAKPKG